MRKEFVEEASKIVKDAVEMGASFRLIPNGDTIIAQVDRNDCAVAIAGNEKFIKSMLAAFTYSVISGDTDLDFGEQPQTAEKPANIIDMSTMTARNIKRN